MIRLAAERDLPSITGIYDAIPDREEAGPAYTNWQRGKNPTKNTARRALADHTLYVGEEGGLRGVVSLNGIRLPEYAVIPRSLPARADQVGVIHTLCIHPSCAGRGYARQMAVFCEETRRQGKTVMRPDTWEHNTPANRMYPALGYRLAGAAEFFFMDCVHEVLNCYEKIL